MSTGILVTNGGPHSADKWAEATASHIVEIADHIAGEKRGAAIKLQAAIIDILTAHHTTIQIGERAALQNLGHARLQTPLEPTDHLAIDQAVADIIAAANGTPWAAEFSDPTAAVHLHALLRQHFATSMHIERSWHADRNPAAPESVQFRATHNVGGA
jgi:hypothetical protein